MSVTLPVQRQGADQPLSQNGQADAGAGDLQTKALGADQRRFPLSPEMSPRRRMENPVFQGGKLTHWLLFRALRYIIFFFSPNPVSSFQL